MATLKTQFCVVAALCLALAVATPPSGLAAGKADPPPACPGGLCPGLGNSFYLPSYDALGTFTGGKIFFKNQALGGCVRYQPVSKASRSFQYSDNTETFFKKVGSETGISGSYESLELTFEATLSATTGYSISTTESIQALALDITYLTGVLDFVQDTTCWSADNIDGKLLAAFEALPEVTDPSSSASWIPYVSFLQTWGSHVMVQQTLGSRFQQWESVLASSKTSQDTLQAKACAEVEGLSEGGGWSVEGCAEYTSEEKKEAFSHSTEESENILGGTDVTRKGLLKGITEETLGAFIDSADQADEAVEHGWEPIWNLLIRFYQPDCKAGAAKSCDNYQRALNLAAAFEGWLAVGCSHETARGRDIQIMKVAATDSATGIKTYGCWAKKEGCMESGDCHLGGAGSVCYCYGNGCIVKDASQPAGTSYRDKVQSKQTGSYDQGVNRSCSYKVGATCKCQSGKVVGLDDRYLWQQ